MSDKAPSIFDRQAITSGNSPVTLDVATTQGHPITGLVVVNEGSVAFTVQMSISGDSFGDAKTIGPGDSFPIQAPTVERESGKIDKVKITRGTADSIFSVIASAGFVDYHPNAPISMARVQEPVQQYGAIGGGTNKINYVVTAGKNLFIQQWHVSVSEGKGNIFELQDDGTSLAALATGEDGGNGGTMNFSDSNPIGPIAAGSTVRIHRDTGDAGKDWSGGFTGFEVDN